MSQRTNRREKILATASELFRKQGYATTSVRQIAEDVGVTEAALYYHFKDGKRELLKEVFECEMPDLDSVVERCQGVSSLPELVHCLGTFMAEKMTTRLDQLRWILSEFAKMDTDERALFHDKQLHFHNGLTEIVRQFVDDDEEADHLAWLIGSAMFGYGQLFFSLELGSLADFPFECFVNMLSSMVDAYLARA